MPKAAENSQQQSITLFDAKERFYVCRTLLDELGQKLEKLAGKRHPGVVDLMHQFSLLRSISMQASQKIENQDPENDHRPLKPRALSTIEQFEYLVFDFKEILYEAYDELVDYAQENSE
jgi:hypothetical protein